MRYAEMQTRDRLHGGRSAAMGFEWSLCDRPLRVWLPNQETKRPCSASERERDANRTKIRGWADEAIIPLNTGSWT